MNYTTYTATLANLMITQVANADFQQILPTIIEYAEKRIYRDLDLLETRVTDFTQSLVANDRNFALPADYIVIEQINLITPAGTVASSGTRNPLIPVSKAYLDTVWTGGETAAQPVNFAMVDQENIVVGPLPNANYNMEVIGTQRPTPLSSTNTETFITEQLWDLFIVASMIFASGYQKNFGAQSDDPKMSASWEDQYMKLLSSCDSEEWRKKFMASAWSSIQPSRVAQPARK